jgi:hypothetical protein
MRGAAASVSKECSIDVNAPPKVRAERVGGLVVLKEHGVVGHQGKRPAAYKVATRL